MKSSCSGWMPVRALCMAAAVGGVFSLSAASALAQKAAAPVASLEPAIQANLHLQGAAVVKLNVAAVEGVGQQVVVPIAGQLATLDLLPYSVRAEGYVLWEQRADGYFQIDPGVETTLRGTVLGSAGSIVAGGLVKGELYARVILGDDREYWIEPIGGRVPGAEPGTYVIYTPDNAMRGDHHCGNTEMPVNLLKEVEEGGVAPRGTTLHFAQLATDADWEYFLAYGGTTWVSQRISAIINTMNVAYERDVNIAHLISQSIVRTTSADPYTTTDPATLNAQIQSEWNGMSGSRDVIQLFTGREIDGSVIGRANAIGSICAAGTGASNCYAQSDFNNNFMSATDLSQHELGHLWDASHCTCSSPPSTMNPNITSINSFRFSTNNNIGQIIAYRDDRTCLTTNGTGGPPRNNDCLEGVPISTGRFGFSNSGATTDPAPVPTACGSMGDDIWYTYLAPCNGTLNIDTCNNANEEPGFDTVIAVYTGSCSSLVLVECNDDDAACTVSNPPRRSLVNFPVTRNTLYRIRVGGFGGANGSGVLDVDLTGQSCPPVPANDDCVNGTSTFLIAECDGTIALSNIGAQSDGTIEVTDCNFSSSQSIFNDVWYRVIAPCTGTIRVSSCGSAIDTKIAIYTSCPTTNNTALACNDDNGPACTGLDSSLDFSASSGSDYYIRIGSYNPATEGNISLSIHALSCPIPTNDTCSNSTATAVSLGLTNINNVNACDNTAAGCGSGQNAVFYRFIPTDSCTYAVETCDLATWDTVIGIYAECTSSTPIICNDDACGLQTRLTFNGTAGADYFIRLHGFGGASGTGQMRIEASAPSNNACATPTAIGNGVFPYGTCGATTDGPTGCTNLANDVWFRYTASCTGMATATTCSSDRTYDTVIAVYRGTCASPVQLGCNDDGPPSCPVTGVPFSGSTVTWATTAGTQYLVRVGGYQGDTGSSELTLTCVVAIPPCRCNWNQDNFVNSQDFFDFLAAFFSNNADYNLDGFTNSQDFFDFLTCFFNPGGFGC